MDPCRAPRLSLVLFPLAVALVAPRAPADAETDRRCSIVSAGDVNGDGACDLAVAERGPGAVDFLEPGPEPPLDRVWILSGKDGELLRTLRPPRGCPAFGRAMENVGDLNGDGTPELAISGGGPLWVFSGADGSVLFELAGELCNPGFGRSLDGGEDVDGDGVPDIVVFRAPHEEPEPRSEPVLVYSERAGGLIRFRAPQEEREPPVGLVLIYSGRSGELIKAFGNGPKAPLPAWDEANLYRVLPGDEILDAVGLLPDRNGDGRAELAVCIAVAESEERGDARSWLEIVDPRTGSSLQSSELPGQYRMSSSTAGPWVVRNLGDADGDGVDDVLLSIINCYVLLYSGANGEELRRHDYVGAYLNAEGTSLDVIGDLDGDGVAEYIIGANEEIDTDWGFSNLHSGATGALLQSMSEGILPDIPDRALPFRGDRTNKSIGIDTCALGDTNGDGIPDIAVHLPVMEEVRVLSGLYYRELLKVRTSPLLMHNVRK